MSARIVKVLLALVVVGIGFATYQAVGVSHKFVPRRISQLVISTATVRSLKAKPSAAQLVLPPTKPQTLFDRIQRDNPEQTGAFQAKWASKASKTSGVALLLQFLPTQQQAQQVLNGERKLFSNPKYLTSQSLKQQAEYSVPGLPSASGATYAIASSQTPDTTAYSITLADQRAVMIETASGTTAITRSDVAAVGRQEAALLNERLPGFSLVVSSRPGSVELGFALGTLFCVAAVFGIPWLIHRARTRDERLEARYQRQSRAAVASRGSKTLQRGRASASSPRARR